MREFKLTYDKDAGWQVWEKLDNNTWFYINTYLPSTLEQIMKQIDIYIGKNT